MKEQLKKALNTLVRNDTAWKVLRSFSLAGVYMNNIRRVEEIERQIPKTEEAPLIFKQRTVLHGPFKGMQYPDIQSVGSAIYPKLIGCYEKEIHSVLGELSKNHYAQIIDVGCAEGYYAVGLARMIPSATVYAYDVVEKARELCKKMADVNGVSGRVEVRSYCSARELQEFQFKGPALIVCDCEGFEINLFNEENIQNLKNCDLIIEAHDFVDITISTRLTQLFSKTHNVTAIKSIDDIEKAKTYHYPETEGMSLETKKMIFAEERPTIMEWLVCRPK